MFGNKGEKVDLMAFAKALATSETLQEENKRLHAQIDRLQEALIAATAAKAYDSMQAAKYNLDSKPTPEQEAAFAKQKQEGEFWSKYVEAQEKPLFTDAEEMIMSLGKNISVDVGGEPIIPGNTES